MFIVGFTSPGGTSDEDENFVDNPAFIVIIVLGGVGVVVAVAIAVIVIISRHHNNKSNNEWREPHIHRLGVRYLCWNNFKHNA